MSFSRDIDWLHVSNVIKQFLDDYEEKNGHQREFIWRAGIQKIATTTTPIVYAGFPPFEGTFPGKNGSGLIREKNHRERTRRFSRNPARKDVVSIERCDVGSML